MGYRGGSSSRTSDVPTTRSRAMSVAGVSNMRNGATARHSQSVEGNTTILERYGEDNTVETPDSTCRCGPDFFNNILGPTADETILLGIQTLLGFCMKCSPEEDPAPTEEEDPAPMEVEDDISQDDIGSADDCLSQEIDDELTCLPTPRNSCNREVASVPQVASISCELQTMMCPTESHESQTERTEMQNDDSQTMNLQGSDSFRASSHSVRDRIGQKCVTSHKSQPTFQKSPSRVSVRTKRSTTSQSRNIQNPTPSKSILKSSSSSRSTKSSSGNCTCRETSDEINSCQCQSPENYSTECSCSTCKPRAMQKTCKSSCIKSTTRCKCYSTKATSGATKTSYPCTCGRKRRAKGVCSCWEGYEACSPIDMAKGYQECNCNDMSKGYHECNCIAMSQGHHECNCIDMSQGCQECNCIDMSNSVSQMGDANDAKVRYAITKITKFFSYTTFEVMRSTSKKPKVIPKSLEGVFVMRNCSQS